MNPIDPINRITNPFLTENLPVPDLPSTGNLPSPYEFLSGYSNESNSQNPFQYYRLSELNKRYPTHYFGIEDLEDFYAQRQSVYEKWLRTGKSFGAIAASTALSGTVGLAYGIIEAIREGRFSSLIDNEVTRGLDEWSSGVQDNNALYRTAEERSMRWWEPENLTKANFWLDNIVKNLGFAVGAIATGGVYSTVLKGIGLSARLGALGTRMASSADEIVSAAARTGNISAANTALSGMWNTAKRTAGSAIANKGTRAIASVLAASGEAALESLHNGNEFRANLIDNFIKERGYKPTLEDIEEINSLTDSVHKSSYFMNLGILSLSNFLIFPKVMFSPFKNTFSTSAGAIGKLGSEYVVGPTTRLGKIFHTAKRAGTLATTIFNPIEGLEEGLQYAVTLGSDYYYNKKFKDQPTSFLGDFIGHGLVDTFSSDEGWLNIFSGAVSGALMTLPGNLASRGFTGTGGAKGRLTKEAVAALNNTKIKKAFADKFLSFQQSEKKAQDAVNSKNPFEFNVNDFDSIYEFIATRIKYGASELINLEIDDLLDDLSTPEGIQKLINEKIIRNEEDAKALSSRLKEVKSIASIISSLTEDIKAKYNSKEGFGELDISALVHHGSATLYYADMANKLASELKSTHNISQGDIDKMSDKASYEALLEYASTGKKSKNLEGFSEDFLNKIQDLDFWNLVLNYRFSTNLYKNHATRYKNITEKPTGYDSVNDIKKALEKEAERVKNKKKATQTQQSTAQTQQSAKQTQQPTSQTQQSTQTQQPAAQAQKPKQFKYFNIDGSGKAYVRTYDESGMPVNTEVNDLVKDSFLAITSEYGEDSKAVENIAKIYNELEHIYYGFSPDENFFKETFEDESKLKEFIDKFSLDKKDADIDEINKYFKSSTEQKFEENLINSILNEIRRLALNVVKDKQRLENAPIEQILDIIDSEIQDKAEKERILQEAFRKNNVTYSEDVLDKIKSLDSFKKHVSSKAANVNELVNFFASNKAKEVSLDDSDFHDVSFKKSDFAVINGTVNPQSEKEHHVRAEVFLNNYYKFSKKKMSKLRLVPVTKRNERAFGAIGIIDTLVEGTNIDPNTVIAMVVVELNEKGGYSIVNELGEPIVTEHPLGSEEDMREKGSRAVFQVIPAEQLEMNYAQKDGTFKKETMFRKTTPQEVRDRLKQLYKKKRERLLSLDTVEMYPFEVSIGILSFEDAGPITRTGLITEDEISNGEVTVEVPTENFIIPEKGMEYSNPLGKVFVRKNGVGLFRMKLNRIGVNRAEVIFSVFKKIAENFEKLSKEEAVNRSKPLFDYLRSVLHWGIHEKQKKYSVWFDSNGLHIGEETFSFNTQDLEKNKDKILNLLSSMHHNVTKSMVGKNKPYTEITEIDKTGNIKTKTWRSYEEYLLSGKNRKLSDLPLYTDLVDYTLYEGKYMVYFDNFLDDSGINQTETTINILGFNIVVSISEINGKKVPSVKKDADISAFVDFVSKKLKVQNARDYVLEILEKYINLSEKGYKIGIFDNKVVFYKINDNLEIEIDYNKNEDLKIREKSVKGVLFSQYIAELLGITINIPSEANPSKTVVNNREVLYETNNNGKVVKIYYNKDHAETFLEMVRNFAEKNKDIYKVKRFADYVSSLIYNSVQKAHDKFLTSVGKGMSSVPGPEGNIIHYIKDDRGNIFILDTTPSFIKEVSTIAEKLASSSNLSKEEAINEAKKYIYTYLHKIISSKKEEVSIKSLKTPDGGLVHYSIDESGNVVIDMESPYVKKKISEYQKKFNVSEKEASIIVISELKPYAAEYKLIPGTVNSVVFGPQKRLLIFNYSSDGKINVYKGKADYNEALKEYIENYRKNNPNSKETDAQIEIIFKNEVRSHIKNVYSSYSKSKKADIIYSGTYKTKNNRVIEYSFTKNRELLVDTSSESFKAALSDFEKTYKGDPSDLLITFVKNLYRSIIETNPDAKAAVQGKPSQEQALKKIFGGEQTQKKESPDKQQEILNKIFGQEKTADKQKTETSDKQQEILNKIFGQTENKKTPPNPDDQKRALDRIFGSNTDTPFNDDAEFNEDEEPPFRLSILENMESFKGENWEEVEKWLAKNFPNIPVYRVKHVIRTTNGRTAWGMLKNASIYVYNGALEGTVYHEVFEAVIKHILTPSEIKTLYDEFRSQEGYFKNRFTGELIKYSEATDNDIKEELAERFAEYVLRQQKPKNLIERIFQSIIDFIKSFFVKPTAAEELFKRINTGKFSTYRITDSPLVFSSEGFRDIDYINSDLSSEFRLAVPHKYKQDLFNHMLYETTKMIFGVENIEDKDFTFIEKLNLDKLSKDLWHKILSTNKKNPGILNKKYLAVKNLEKQGIITPEQAVLEIEKLKELYITLEKEWGDFFNEFTRIIRKYNVVEDDFEKLEEGESYKEGYEKQRYSDAIKKTSAVLRLLISTLPEAEYVGGKIQLKRNYFGGVSMVSLRTVYPQLKAALYDSLDVDDMLLRIKKLAKEYPYFALLYQRLTNSAYSEDDSIDLSNANLYHLNLLSQFYKLMKSQKPEYLVLKYFEQGEIDLVEDRIVTSLFSTLREIENSLKLTLLKNEEYIAYDEKDKVYKKTKKAEALEKLQIKKATDAVAFLKTLGIEFTADELESIKEKEEGLLIEAANGIRRSINKIPDKGLKEINRVTLQISGRLNQIAKLKNLNKLATDNVTFIDHSGNLSQTYLGINRIFSVYNKLSKIENLNELVGTEFEYLLKDRFSAYSNLLSTMFDLTTGNKLKNAPEDLLRPFVIDAISEDEEVIDFFELSAEDRLKAYVNMIYKSYFPNLINGDSTSEWIVKMPSYVTPENILLGVNEETVFKYFKNVFLSEYEVSKENRKIEKVENNDPKDLRFFKLILPKELHESIISDTQVSTAEEAYTKYKDRIEEAIADYLTKKATDLYYYMAENKLLVDAEQGPVLSYGTFFSEKNYNREQVIKNLMAIVANHFLNTVELHKLVYSDPYLYKDEFKRIKSFNSPTTELAHSKTFDAKVKEWISKFTKKQPSSIDRIKGATIEDIVLDEPGFYENVKAADSQGYITLDAVFEINLRNGTLTAAEIEQYLHDLKYERLVEQGATREELEEFEKNNPGVESLYIVKKPVVRGNDLNSDINAIHLDKTSLFPLSFRLLHKMNPNSNLMKLYKRMKKSGTDYVVFKSARKTYVDTVNQLFDKDGNFIEDNFEGISELSYSMFNIQVDPVYKHKDVVKKRTAIGIMATLDLYDAGVPSDFMSDKPIEIRIEEWNKLSEEEKLKASEYHRLLKNDTDLQNELTRIGYIKTLEKLGLKETPSGLLLEDPDAFFNLINEVTYLYDIDYNFIETLKSLRNGEIIPEMTPIYSKVKSIVYSLIGRFIQHPHISGGDKVNVSSVLFESKAQLNEKKRYVSSDLQFYKDKNGKYVCEIMISRWFYDIQGRTDEEIMDYLNNTPEGQDILSGILQRTPTERQSSIDHFVVKKFLPKEYNDIVVLPGAYVAKTNADYDYDKSSVYFKNVYTTIEGNIKVVPFFGYGEEAKKKIEELYKSGEFIPKEYRSAIRKLVREMEEFGVLEPVYSSPEAIRLIHFMETIYGSLSDWTSENVDEKMKQGIIDHIYRLSIENEYIRNMQRIFNVKENRERITDPVSTSFLSGIASKKKSLDTSMNAIIDLPTLASTRNRFIEAKTRVGIPVNSVKGNSLFQKTIVYIDSDKIQDIEDPRDKFFLGDGSILLGNPNKINNKPVLSISKNQNGELISKYLSSFTTGIVDSVKDTTVIELGVEGKKLNVWLFLLRLGIDEELIYLFLNQPIIDHYMKESPYLFSPTKYGNFIKLYGKISKNQNFPTKKELKEMLVKDPGNLSITESMQQSLILREFLKYAKMSDYLFKYESALNYLSTSLNDPAYVAFQKFRVERARNQNIFTSFDGVMKNSILGKLQEYTEAANESFFNFLPFLKNPTVRGMIDNFMRYFENTPKEEFSKIYNRLIINIIDYGLSKTHNLEKDIPKMLLTRKKQDNFALEVYSYLKTLQKSKDPIANNLIIKHLKMDMLSTGSNKPVNLYIENLGNSVYDKNTLISDFVQLREYLISNDKKHIYDAILKITLLQGGLSDGKYSLKPFVPFEDYIQFYKEAAAEILDNSELISEFFARDVFFRTNWSNPSIVPSISGRLVTLKKPIIDPISGAEIKYISNPEMRFLPKELKVAVNKKLIDQVIKISTNSRNSDSDYIVYKWRKPFSSKKVAQMKKRGDYSYIGKGLFKKVKDAEGNPVVLVEYGLNGEMYSHYVYRAINAWGYSSRLTEFVISNVNSPIDNNFIKAKENNVKTDDGLFTQDEYIAYLTDSANKKAENKLPKCK